MTDPHILQPGHAPTPFTFEEIRAGCPAGRTIRLTVEEPQSSYQRIIRFLAVDEEGADQESWETTPAGDPIGEPAFSWSSWLDLQTHASFPEAAVDIQPGQVKTPLGAEECLIYRVSGERGTNSFWFATGRPGMPVKVETAVEGAVVYRMVMIEDELKPS